MYGIKSATYIQLFLLFISISTSLGGCTEVQDIKPKNLIPEDIYIDLLVELQLLRSYSYTDPALDKDSAAVVIFKKYSVNAEEFFKSHDFYQTQIEKQIERVNLAIERIKREQTLKTEGESPSMYRDTLPY